MPMPVTRLKSPADLKKPTTVFQGHIAQKLSVVSLVTCIVTMGLALSASDMTTTPTTGNAPETLTQASIAVPQTQPIMASEDPNEGLPPMMDLSPQQWMMIDFTDQLSNPKPVNVPVALPKVETTAEKIEAEKKPDPVKPTATQANKPATTKPKAPVTAQHHALHQKWQKRMLGMPQAQRLDFIAYLAHKLKEVPGQPKPDWALQMIEKESKFNPKAVNKAGRYYGLFQIHGESHLVSYTPTQQVDRWVAFLKSKSRMFGPLNSTYKLKRAQGCGYSIVNDPSF